MLKKLGLGLAALIAAGSIAFAGGAFQGWPLVGGDGATNCLSFGNNGVCNQFQPAGPPSLSGNETVPADTNIQGGGSNANSSTVNIPILLLGGGTTNFSAPLTGATVTAASTDSLILLNPAGTLATLTIALPAAATLKNGQRLRIASSQTITALTISGGTGTSVTQNPTALTVSTTAPYNYEFIYVASNATNGTWYRVQ